MMILHELYVAKYFNLFTESQANAITVVSVFVSLLMTILVILLFVRYRKK